jgi:hypothetical protein
MWILPKSLISAFAQDTEALTLGCVELSQTCARSLMRRSKPSQSSAYLREWKAGNLMRLRSGAISNPSHGRVFTEWWTSSLAVTHASHSVPPGSEQEQTTQDTCGPLLQMELGEWLPEYVSLKMSRDISLLDSERSLQNWKNLVTKRRGEYSARLKLARLTSESESSSWPTATTRDWKDTITGTHPPSRPLLGQQTLGQAVSVMSGQVAQGNHSTHGSRPELWATPRAGCPGSRAPGTGGKVLEEQVKEPKTWATPRAEMDSGAHRGKPDTLHSQMKAWASLHANCHTGAGQAPEKQGAPNLQTQASGKLNPRWVEALQGLPIGWTMPSCASPVTIAPTNCGSSEME